MGPQRAGWWSPRCPDAVSSWAAALLELVLFALLPSRNLTAAWVPFIASSNKEMLFSGMVC